MSSFICQQCGTHIIDSPSGYVTGCEHWPIEKEVTSFNLYTATEEEWKAMSEQNKMVPVREDVLTELASQCSRMINGVCHTLHCLKRGGYVRGTVPVDYAVATCEYFEAYNALAAAPPIEPTELDRLAREITPEQSEVERLEREIAEDV